MLSNSFIRLKKSYFFILKSCNAALFVLGKSDGVFVVINCFCMLTFQTSVYIPLKCFVGKLCVNVTMTSPEAAFPTPPA